MFEKSLVDIVSNIKSLLMQAEAELGKIKYASEPHGLVQAPILQLGNVLKATGMEFTDLCIFLSKEKPVPKQHGSGEEFNDYQEKWVYEAEAQLRVILRTMADKCRQLQIEVDSLKAKLDSKE